MKLTFSIDYLQDDGKKDVVVLEVESLDVNLVETILDYVRKRDLEDGEDYCGQIAFLKYYDNASMMFLGGCFPYIIKDGRYEWHVPYSEVSIKDFIRTNNIKDSDTIYVDNYSYGGDELGLLDFIDWVLTYYQLQQIGRKAFDDESSLIDFFKSVKAHFSDRERNLINPDDVKEAIRRKKCWTIPEAKEATGIEKDCFMEQVLEAASFEKMEDVYYRKKQTITKRLDKAREECWGPLYEEGGFSEIVYEAHEINIYLTAIKVKAAEVGSDVFNFAMHEVDLLIDSWEGCVCRGKNFRFIEVKEEMEPLDEEHLEWLTSDLKDIHDLLYKVVYYLDSRMSG